MVLYCKLPFDAWWKQFSDSATGGKEKDGHDWQQPEAEAEHYIKALCPKDGLVVDPMCGSGTTAAAALRLGRRCIAIDSDTAVYNYAVERIERLKKELSSDQQGTGGQEHEDEIVSVE